MNIILYPFYVVLNLIGTILTFPLAFVIVLFNSAQDGFAVKYLHGTGGMSYSGDLKCNEQNPGHLLVKGQGLFQYVLFKPMFGKTLYLNLGWNIRALVDPQYVNDPTNAPFIADYPATFAFSPRLV